MKFGSIFSVFAVQLLFASPNNAMKGGDDSNMTDVDGDIGHEEIPEFCHLTSEAGTCSTSERRWFYDDKLKRCRTFVWSGCSGNDNNFRYRGLCEKTCMGELHATPTRAPRPRRPMHVTRHKLISHPIPLTVDDTHMSSEFHDGLPPATFELSSPVLRNIVSERLNHYSNIDDGDQDQARDEDVISHREHRRQEYNFRKEYQSREAVHSPFSTAVEYGPMYVKVNSNPNVERYHGDKDGGETQHSVHSSENRKIHGNQRSHHHQHYSREESRVESSHRPTYTEVQYPSLASYPNSQEHANENIVLVSSNSGRLNSGSSILFSGMNPICAGRESYCRQSCVLKNYLTDEDGCQTCKCDDPERANKNFKYFYIDESIVRSRRMLCSQPAYRGPCSNKLVRWHFDPVAGSCTMFEYGGCRGNENNFYSEESCVEYCTATADDSRTSRQKWYKTILGLLKK